MIAVDRSKDAKILSKQPRNAEGAAALPLKAIEDGSRGDDRVGGAFEVLGQLVQRELAWKLVVQVVPEPAYGASTEQRQIAGS